MSLDSDSPPSSSRDWLFPSPAYSHSAHSSYHPANSPKYPRRFTTTPRTSHPRTPDPRPSRTLRNDGVPASNPIPYRDFRYAGVRRRFDLSRRTERLPKPDDAGAVSGRKSEITAVSREKECTAEKVFGFSGRIFRIRWKMAISVAVVLSLSLAVLHNNG